MAIRQTAGRDSLGEFAPKFAELNDDVLFGEVWSREDKLSLRDRSLVTVTALMAQGLVDSSFRFHLMSAKNNGITREEIAEILTHAAFYAGWPKAWAAFRMAKEVWTDEQPEDARAAHASSMIFPIGAREYHVRRNSSDNRTNADMFLISGNVEVLESAWLLTAMTKDTDWLAQHIRQLEGAASLTEHCIDQYGRLWSDVFYEDQIIEDGTECLSACLAANGFAKLAHLEKLLGRHEQAAHYYEYPNVYWWVVTHELLGVRPSLTADLLWQPLPDNPCSFKLETWGIACRCSEAGRLPALYVLFRCIVPPCGHLTRRAVLMSNNWMPNVWTRDSVINAMGLAAGDPELAKAQFFLSLDLQTPEGLLPDYINPREVMWNFTKPPIHEIAVLYGLLDAFTLQELERAYDGMERQTDYWLRYMDSDRDGIPQYNHGNDCGWDNCTCFRVGLPIEGPDLCAYLILQMRALAQMAQRLGISGRDWQAEASVLLHRLLAHSFGDGRFHVFQSGTHREFAGGDSESLPGQKVLLLDGHAVRQYPFHRVPESRVFSALGGGLDLLQIPG